MELWCVKDNPQGQEIKFSCQTLYNLRLKKHSIETVLREHTLEYRNIWTYFGLTKSDLTRAELHLISHLYLKTLFLFMPTMSMNKGDDEDSDHEEKVLISNKKIENVAFVRRILTVKNKPVPATVSLVGCDGQFYLGIKVTLYDPVTIIETGFFLTVKQASWERSESEKSMIRKKVKTRFNLLLEHFKLPNYINGLGGDFIFKQMKIKSRKDLATL